MTLTPRFRLLFYLSLAIALSLTWSLPSGAQSRERVVRRCLNGLLYTDIDYDGDPGFTAERTVVGQGAAAIACEGVRSQSEAREIRRCVLGVLYTNTNFEGSPSFTAERTEILPEAAARACRRCPNDGGGGYRYRDRY